MLLTNDLQGIRIVENVHWAWQASGIESRRAPEREPNASRSKAVTMRDHEFRRRAIDWQWCTKTGLIIELPWSIRIRG